MHPVMPLSGDVNGRATLNGQGCGAAGERLAVRDFGHGRTNALRADRYRPLRRGRDDARKCDGGDELTVAGLLAVSGGLVGIVACVVSIGMHTRNRD